MDIPYGKIAVYVLTFLSYIYLGYGNGILTNLRDAVITAESIFGDVLQNVIKVANNIRSLHEVIDAAVEEHCRFQCLSGAFPKKNRNHIPTANSCGALSLKISNEYLPIKEITKCCDKHDICYDTCNNDKETCDIEFKKCLYKYCDSFEKSVGGSSIVKACKGAAKVVYTGTLTLGCKFYLDAQAKACYCPSEYGWKEGNKYKFGKEL